MILTLIFIIYALIGGVAGILGGMLGIGGGVITVPCLFYLFRFLEFPQAYVMHMAIATSLAAMIFNTLSATWSHHQHGTVLWKILKKMIPGFVLGSILGALIASALSGILLEIFFACFLFFLAFRFFIPKKQKKERVKIPSRSVLTFYSSGIGILSNILGIGGGTMTVPLLISFKIPDTKAIGTSAAATLFTSILGSISYLILGWGNVPGAQNIGLINLPAFLIVGIATFFTAPYGVKLTHELSPKKVRKIFACVLTATGILLMVL